MTRLYRITILSQLNLTTAHKMTSEEALDTAVAHAGTVQNLADHLGVTKGAVSQWKTDGRRIPAEHCPAIERLTNGTVRCEHLRPDVDWAYLRLASGAMKPRRATDPEPPPGRAGRRPPSVKNIMEAATEQPVLYKRKPSGPP